MSRHVHKRFDARVVAFDYKDSKLRKEEEEEEEVRKDSDS